MYPSYGQRSQLTRLSLCYHFVASNGENQWKHISGFIRAAKYNKRQAVEKGNKSLGGKKVVKTSTGRSVTQKSNRQAPTTLCREKSPVKSFTPSFLTLSPFVRARKSVQRYLISPGNPSTFSKSNGCVCRWLPKLPPVFLRISNGLLERE